MKAFGRIAVGALFIFVCGVVTGIYVIQDRSQLPLVQSASAQQPRSQPPRISPTKAVADRDVYFPGTEDLKPDEMRVTALGTGMPS